MCVLIMLQALAYVAGKAGDIVMQTIAFAGAGAVTGCFVWNFPVARSEGDVRFATRSPTSGAAGLHWVSTQAQNAPASASPPMLQMEGSVVTGPLAPDAPRLILEPAQQNDRK